MTGVTRLVRAALLVLLVFLVVAIPLGASNYAVRVAALILVMTTLSVGLNLILGYTGLLSFGHAALFGVGAYTTARMLIDDRAPLLVVALASVLLAAVVGALVGLASWRVGGDYLALITLGFGEVFFLYVNNAKITGASTGLPGVPIGNLFGWELRTVQDMYVFALAVAALAMTVSTVLTSSFLGRAMLAIREDEIVAKSMGINVPLTKVVVFAIGSGIAGLAGFVQALLLGFVGPASFDIETSVLAVEIVLIGGMARTWGPLLGSVVVIGSTEYLRSLVEYRELIFGVLVLVILIWRPGGLAEILGLGRGTSVRLLGRRRPPPPPARIDASATEDAGVGVSPRA